MFIVDVFLFVCICYLCCCYLWSF